MSETYFNVNNAIYTLHTNKNVGIGVTNPSSKLDIGGTMDVSGAAQLASLNVSGNTDIDGTFDAAGASNFQSTIAIQGAIDANSSMNLQGAAVLQSTLQVDGAVDANSSMNLQGAAVLQSTLQVDGAVDANSSMNLQGAAVLQSTLQVDGAVDINAAMDVSGNAQLGSLNVTANADIDGTFDAQGASNFQSTVAIVDDLAVDTDTLFVDASTDRVGINTSSPTEALDIDGNLHVNGNIKWGVDPNWTLDCNAWYDANITYVGGSGTEHARFGFHSTSGALSVEMDGSLLVHGDIDYHGDIDDISDGRFKNDQIIVDYTDCYEKVQQLDLKNYKWSDFMMENFKDLQTKRSQSETGFIAQEVEEVFPTAIKKKEAFNVSDFRYVKYNQIFLQLYGAFRESQKKIAALEEKVAALE
jgi:cytoskeletal protein CcmA (bactofilin family)